MGLVPITHTFKRKVSCFAGDRYHHNDHSLCMFIGSADHRVHTIDQSNDHAASSSSRTYAGARSISRKIGKLKAALPSPGSRGCQLPNPVCHCLLAGSARAFVRPLCQRTTAFCCLQYSIRFCKMASYVSQFILSVPDKSLSFQIYKRSDRIR